MTRHITQNQVEAFVDKYIIHISVEYEPSTEPRIVDIYFEPPMLADDLRYDKDIIVPHIKDKKITFVSNEVIIPNLNNCKVCNTWIEPLIVDVL